jgi:pimeloyl-ACP methyl ester carboxylesterase
MGNEEKTQIPPLPSFLGHTSHSTAKSVEDLNVLLKAILTQLPNHNESASFHLMGHSYGGLLAYKFASQPELPQPLRPISLILANTPTSIRSANTEYERLAAENPLTFVNQYVCRVGMMLSSLASAMQHAGTIWGGMDAVLEDMAEPLVLLCKERDTQAEEISRSFPRTLVLSGVHDFCFSSSNALAWAGLLPPSFTSKELDTCAHYPFYEDGPAFGRAVETFLDESDVT